MKADLDFPIHFQRGPPLSPLVESISEANLESYSPFAALTRLSDVSIVFIFLVDYRLGLFRVIYY